MGNESQSMSDREIALAMHSLAKEFLDHRYPTGWGGVAVLRLADGTFLTSVAIETANGGASLCIETGAICEAHKLAKRVTHSACFVREDETKPLCILTACGICQERLRFWGDDVKIAVTGSTDPFMFLPLSGLQPFHWSAAYDPSELEHFE